MRYLPIQISNILLNQPLAWEKYMMLFCHYIISDHKLQIDLSTKKHFHINIDDFYPLLTQGI